MKDEIISTLNRDFIHVSIDMGKDSYYIAISGESGSIRKKVEGQPGSVNEMLSNTGKLCISYVQNICDVSSAIQQKVEVVAKASITPDKAPGAMKPNDKAAAAKPTSKRPPVDDNDDDEGGFDDDEDEATMDLPPATNKRKAEAAKAVEKAVSKATAKAPVKKAPVQDEDDGFGDDEDGFGAEAF